MKSSSSSNSPPPASSAAVEKPKLVFVGDNEDKSLPIGTHHGGSFEVYMNHKVDKLRQLHTVIDSSDKQSSIFQGCILYVNGVTNPPIEEIRRLVNVNGGEVVNYRVRDVTHVICDYYTDAQLKIELARQKMTASKTRLWNVTALWVTESVKTRKRLSELDFIPKGLKIKAGTTILESLQKMTSSSSSSSAVEINDCLIDVSSNADNSRNNHVPTSSASPLLLPDHITSSQEEFVRSLPRDLRGEVLEQLSASTVSHSSDESKATKKHSLNDLTVNEEEDNIEVEKEENESAITKKRRILLNHPLFNTQLQEIIDEIFAVPLLSSAKRNLLVRKVIRNKLQQQLLTYSALNSSNDLSSSEFQFLLISFGVWMLEKDYLEQVISVVITRVWFGFLFVGWNICFISFSVPFKYSDGSSCR
jgi:hypothetical protein